MASRDKRRRAWIGRRTRRRLGHENEVFAQALGAAAVPTIVAIALLWLGEFSHHTRLALALLMLAFAFGFAATVRSTVVRPLRTLANMQAAVREGDFSFRARSAAATDSLGELMFEVNALASTLQDQRVGAFEAGALMRKVLSEIEVAVFAFDAEHRLRLLNRTAERLIAQVSERAIGKTAAELGVDDLLEGEAAQTIERQFPGRSGRWGIRRTAFRQGGIPHQLVVVTDLSRALREEERAAWQRLVRVLAHELNNSLAPIKSISHGLHALVEREPRPDDWEEDVRRGLSIIAERSDALARFVADYSRLARLPRPNVQSVAVAPLLRRIAGLDGRRAVTIHGGPDASIHADPDQLEQLFINLVRNAIDASVATGGEVAIGWHVHGGRLRVRIVDEGTGIANGANLFVPFFTTKPGGSGIGLAVARQIVEAHAGHVSLKNRLDRPGAEAIVELPLEWDSRQVG